MLPYTHKLLRYYITIWLITISPLILIAQQNTATLNATLAVTYAKQNMAKLNAFTNNVNKKTLQTLTKCAKWESKIKRLLIKVNPAKAQQLFNNNTLSFETILTKYKNGMLVLDNAKANYNQATDKLATHIKYIQQQKNVLTQAQKQQLNNTDSSFNTYETEEKKQALLLQLIAQRKTQLLQAAQQQLKNNKWFSKINNECYYYVDAIQNYRSILTDPNKMQQLAITMLEKLPAFQQFFRQFSAIGQMFPAPPNGTNNIANLAGLQTSASVAAQIQGIIGASAEAQQSFTNNINNAKQQFNNLKNKALAKANPNNNFDMPSPKKYNTQHNKSLWQRMALKTDWQPEKNNGFIPNNINMGLGLSYKLNDKKEIGTMLTYKLGLGNGIRNLNLTNEGIGWRSFADIKFKKNFWLTGGYEQVYMLRFNNITALQNINQWQRLALAGLSKKYSLGKKTGEFKVLYNFLARTQPIPTQPLIFRTGINF